MDSPFHKPSGSSAFHKPSGGSAFHKPPVGSAFHKPPDGGEPFEVVSRRRVSWQLDPGLTYRLKGLDGMPMGEEFRERAVEVSTSKALGDPVDRAKALTAFRWFLDRADGEGFPLTAAGYLKPDDVRAFAEVLPTMHGWLFKITREVDTRPVLWFREYLKQIKLLRKYKGTLRLTRLGRAINADTDELWEYVADTMMLQESEFGHQASVALLVHAATTDGAIDLDAVAETLTQAGWRFDSGDPVGKFDVMALWRPLWHVLGNVGEPVVAPMRQRMISREARLLIHDALFTEIDPIGT